MHVPEGWSKSTIGELCEFINGNGFKPNEWSNEGLPIIRIQNLNGSNDFNYYRGEPLKKWLVNPGQLLFAWAGTKGVSFGPKIWAGPQAVLNQHIFKLNPISDINTFWFYNVLVRTTGQIESCAHGFKSTLLHVQKSDITEQSILVPPRPEQHKIAKILSSWDKAIEKLEALIAAKQKRQKALMQQLLTGKKRFAKFVKSDEMQKTKFGTIPTDWQYLHIAEVAKQLSVKNHAGHDLPVLSCTKHYGLVDSLAYFGRQIFSEDTSTYKVAPRKTFAYATNHIEEGSIGYQNLYDEALISPMYTVFQTTKNINDEFLYRVLKTELYRHIFEVNTSASVDRRGSLRWNQFAAIKIPVLLYPSNKRLPLFSR
ncbi:MAG TPA: restriction endonuclease subunit S [Methylobacter sp.]|jgi:type I restriction enzyme S subunit